ncbi:hydantoinase B/oxoprolinase family protein [Pseudonocardia thermophila]|uniref:hydantoinase B/oxoprolinase family protein n=1 Tax=Pseudonocardia thermophila TaxID=1848 RepID=UPI00248DFF78|nr:hydantoinase B/oxoprolinase family protein [Pseudonocardia thermophila]
MSAAAAPRSAAITDEIIRGALVAITDEMKTNLMRTAYNPIIYEALDYTVGLFDANGDTVSIGLGLPMFIKGLSETVKAKIAHWGLDGLHPGDVLLTNDAYVTGSHLNHIVLTVPVFHDGRVVAFASSMAHWIDIGGVLGGRTTDIYSEGLQIPFCKVVKDGIEDEEILAFIKMNVRRPELALGDYRAQMAAIRTGQRRLSTLLERYGLDTVLSSIERMYAHSEALARAVVARVPDGTYSAETIMDDDGITDEPIPIKVTVTIHGNRMIVDLTEISPQVAGYFNSGAAAGRSASQVAFKCLTTPLLMPINEGAFRPLEVVLPPGRVVSAERPAAMQRWMTIPITVVDTIFKALAEAMPDTVHAAHHADLNIASLSGIDQQGRFFQDLVNIPGGGWGAGRHADGMPATVCINDGDTHNTPVEANEARLPIHVETYRLRDDSGGAGRYRGGLGVEMTTRVLCAARFSAGIERTRSAPWGLAGGHAGAPNEIRYSVNGQDVVPPTGKIDATMLAPGDYTQVTTSASDQAGEVATESARPPGRRGRTGRHGGLRQRRRCP